MFLSRPTSFFSHDFIRHWSLKNARGNVDLMIIINNINHSTSLIFEITILVSVIARGLSRRWGLFSVFWSTCELSSRLDAESSYRLVFIVNISNNHRSEMEESLVILNKRTILNLLINYSSLKKIDQADILIILNSCENFNSSQNDKNMSRKQVETRESLSWGSHMTNEKKRQFSLISMMENASTI